MTSLDHSQEVVDIDAKGVADDNDHVFSFLVCRKYCPFRVRWGKSIHMNLIRQSLVRQNR